MEKQAVYLRIGSKIRDARRERGLNQEEVGRMLDLTRTAITNIETGRQGIQVHQLFQLAEALDIPLLELLDIDWVSLKQAFVSNDATDQLPENLASVVSRFQDRIAR